MNTPIRRVKHRAMTGSLLLIASTLPFFAAAQEERPEELEPPVIIKPDKDHQVESIRLANGQIRYKVTPRSGKAYCFVMEERKPLDRFSTGATYRVPCPKSSE